jgi:hypothetical protein
LLELLWCIRVGVFAWVAVLILNSCNKGRVGEMEREKWRERNGEREKWREREMEREM